MLYGYQRILNKLLGGNMLLIIDGLLGISNKLLEGKRF